MNTIDPQLEAEYNNRLKVPDHPSIMAGWKHDAAAFRSEHPHMELGVSYGAGERQAFDIFWPAADRLAPVAMFVHGGYWAALDRSWFSHLAKGFLAHDVALAIPSYDLCPSISLELLVDEIRQAAAFLIKRHGRDVYATGHSAGGHLTAMLLATNWAQVGVPEGKVYGGCAISGLFDLLPLTRTSINSPLQLDAERASALSPINLAAPGPLLRTFVGEHEGEEYRRQSRTIAERWRGSFDILPGANHFTAIAPFADPASRLIEAVLAGMRQR